jgi:hypothetical protein
MNFSDQLVSIPACMIHTNEIHLGCALMCSLLTDSNESDQCEVHARLPRKFAAESRVDMTSIYRS